MTAVPIEIRIAAVLMLAVLACSGESAPALRVDLIGAPDGGFLTLRVTDTAEQTLRRVGPVRVVPALEVPVLSVPLGRGRRLVAEVQQTEWTNAPVRYRGVSEAFDFEAGGADVELTIELVAVQEDAGAAPPLPSLAASYHRIPWGSIQSDGQARARVTGTTTPNRLVLLFDGPNVDGDDMASLVAQAVSDEDGRFQVDVPGALSAPAAVYWATVDEAGRLTDASSAVGLQAMPVAESMWTASLYNKVPGSAFPNPHTLSVSQERSEGLAPAPQQVTEATSPQLDGVRGNGRLEISSRRRWRQHRPLSNPPSLTRPGYAYDPVGQQVVLFGGIIAFDTTSAATWTWDGWSWKVRSGGPVGRSAPAMAYHGRLGGVLMFGGFLETTPLNDLWLFDGETWSPVVVASASPPGRFGAAAAYDEQRGLWFMYGGCQIPGDCSDPLDEMWAFNGNRWARLEPPGAGPGPRYEAAMVYDPVQARLLLLGGRGRGNQTQRDLWAFDGVSWRMLSSAATDDSFPIGVSRARAVYDRARRELLAWEHLDLDVQPTSAGAVLWRWNDEGWATATAPLEINGPEPEQPSLGLRYEPALVYDRARQTTVLTSGLSVLDTDTTWLWDGDAWAPRQARPTAPTGTLWTASAYDPSRGVTVLFGGRSDYFTTASLWEWDGGLWQERRFTDGPTARHSASMAYDPGRGGVVLAGGVAATGQNLRSVWLYDGTDWRALPSLPDARFSGHMAYDRARGELVYFGGQRGTSYQSSVWTLGPSSTEWTVEQPSGCPSACPSARAEGHMAYDQSTERVVLQGGMTPSGPVGDVWSWDGTRWIDDPVGDLVVGASLTRAGGAMVYDSARRRLLLFGGRVRGTDGEAFELSDTFERMDGEWRRLPSTESQPNRRSDFAFAFHEATSEMVVFGGVSEALFLRDTWTFDGRDWRQRANEPVSPRRCRPAVAYEPVARRGLMFGGCPDPGCLLSPGFDTTFVWDASGWRALATPLGAPPAGAGSVARSAMPGSFVLHPGEVSARPSAWRFNGSQWQRFATLPSVLLSQTSFDARRARNVFFGGAEFDNDIRLFASDRLYELDIDGRLTDFGSNGGASGRLNHAMAYDEGRGRTVIHGGFDPAQRDQEFADTWTWDGTTWAQGPDGPARSGHGLVYDPVRDKVVLAGGVTSGGLGRADVHEYDGEIWTQVALAESGPDVRTGPGMFFDSERSAIVQHGGQGNECFDDTWLLPSIRALRPAVRLRLDFGVGGFDVDAVKGFTVRTRAGGRGYADTVPGPGQTVPGVRIEAWDSWVGAWFTLAESDADIDVPTELEAPLDPIQRLVRLVRVDGFVDIRVTSRLGVGTGSRPAMVAVETLEVDVAYEPSGL